MYRKSDLVFVLSKPNLTWFARFEWDRSWLVCSVRTVGKELRARAKFPDWEKMEGVCVNTGLEDNRYEVNVQIHSGDLIC